MANFETSRRNFLQLGVGLGLSTLAGPHWLRAAADASPLDRKLVVLELTGGNDALNMLIPYGDDLYHRARPQLRIPQAEVLRLDDHFGLHPRMGALREIHELGDLAIVHGVGYENPDRSHFRALDIWHSGDPLSARPRTGWVGRAADRADGDDGPFAVRVGGRDLPLLLRSEQSDTPTLERLEDLEWDRGSYEAVRARRALQESLLRPRREGGGAADRLQRAWLSAMRDADRLGAAAKNENVADYPAGALAQQLRLGAALLASDVGPRVVHVNQTGYDTHANQTQPHAQLLGDLSSALGAFWSDLRSRGLEDRVLVLVYSEFGRRVNENASAGTDHGAAAPVLLISGKLKGGFHGQSPSLADLSDGDVKHQVDFRRVYATLLEPWLGVPALPVIGEGFAPLSVL